jgi:peptide/nickel transport system substrate-binding protein
MHRDRPRRRSTWPSTGRLDGFGTVANDVFGHGLEFYDSSLVQRTQDITKARQLLAAAGHPDGITLELQTSAAAAGMVEAATLFAQQAKAAGVTVNITNVNPGSYFDPTTMYLKMPFAQSIWTGFNTLSDYYQYSLIPGAAGNETHWNDPATVTAIDAAANAASAWQRVQRQQYDEGGYLWWANVDIVDGCSKKLAGITPTGIYPLGLPVSLATAYFPA